MIVLTFCAHDMLNILYAHMTSSFYYSALGNRSSVLLGLQLSLGGDEDLSCIIYKKG